MRAARAGGEEAQEVREEGGAVAESAAVAFAQCAELPAPALVSLVLCRAAKRMHREVQWAARAPIPSSAAPAPASPRSSSRASAPCRRAT